MRMNSNNYKQYDTRWAKLPYRDLPDNIGNNGCGEVAVCNSIIEMTAQMNQTPKTMQPYCRQYACSDGTYWSGIPAMLKHYGCTEVMEHQNMASLWKELAKGGRVAIYMMNNRPAGYKQIHWTSGGHFICSVAYKYENGEHCVYVKDSNSKESYRNGWMSYESSLRGDVSACWSGKLNGSPAPKPTPTKKTKVIDVSAFQSSINWSKVKAAGIDGAMIRCGYRGYETGKLNQDSMFADHIKGASKAGLKVGVYFFTEALNYSEGKQEAEYTLGLIEKMGIKLYYPIAIDTEAQSAPTERAKNLSRTQRTEAIRGFCETIKSRGGAPMIYASTSWFENKLDMSKLPYAVWCAQYYKECQYKGKVSMWQYTSEGSVNGVKGVVDMNECYITKASPMPKPKPTPSKKGYTGRYPDVHVKRDAAHVVGNAVNFGKWIAGDNDFHYGFGDHAHHNGCYFCGTNGAKKGHMKMWEHTYCCNPFVHACFAHGGLVPSMLKMCQQGRSYGFKQGEGYDASNLFKKINRKDAKAGDVFCSDCHVALYIGNGKIVHAGSEDDNVIHSDSWNKSICIGEWKDKYYDPPRVYRFIGSVDADIVMRKGEVSGRVKDLQNYLIWFGTLPKSEKADGYFSDEVFNAVVKMQKALKVAPDGIVGNATLKAMRAYKK